MLRDGDNLLTVANQSFQPLAQDSLHYGLADHEEVLVQGVLQADPPSVLPRLELAIAKG